MSIPVKEFHIIYGLLLGYQKIDIRAWHLAYALSQYLQRDFLSQRKRLMSEDSVQAFATNFKAVFNELFEAAQDRLDTLITKIRI